MYQVIGYSILESSFPFFIEKEEDVVTFLHQQIWRTAVQLSKAQSFLGCKMEDFCCEIDEERLIATVSCGDHKIMSCEGIRIYSHSVTAGKDAILKTVYTDDSISFQSVVITDNQEIVKDVEVEKENAGKEIFQTHLYDPEEWLAEQKTK